MTKLVEIAQEVKALKDKYGLVRFVETGCYKGDGIAAALDIGFQEVFSCDIQEKWVGYCRDRFRPLLGAVQILHAASTDFIGKIADEGMPALWWLDAHWPEFHDGPLMEGYEFPVLSELRILTEKKVTGVVLCDDMRTLADHPQQSDLPHKYKRWNKMADLINLACPSFLVDLSLLRQSGAVMITDVLTFISREMIG